MINNIAGIANVIDKFTDIESRMTIVGKSILDGFSKLNITECTFFTVETFNKRYADVAFKCRLLPYANCVITVRFPIAWAMNELWEELVDSRKFYARRIEWEKSLKMLYMEVAPMDNSKDDDDDDDDDDADEDNAKTIN